jgi:signal transduction histidine kinase
LERGTTLFEAQAPEYFAALREARTIEVGDVRTDSRCRGLREYCGARHISSVLFVPVWVEGRLAGVLCHEHIGLPRHWSARELAFAAAMGQFVSSALAARAHTVVDAAAQRMAFLDRFSRQLASLDLREVQRTAVTLSVPTLGDVAALFVPRSDGLLDCVALKHVDPSKEATFLEAARAMQPGTFPFVAVRQQQSVLVPDVNPATIDQHELLPTERVLATRLGMRTGIVVPLLVAAKTIGGLAFMKSERPYDTDDLALAENVGVRVASAMENACLYERACEANRARDDLLGLAAHELRTPLTALQLTAQKLQRRTPAGADERDVALADDIIRQVQRFAAIADHVLEASRIRAEGIRIVPGPSDLATIVRDRVARLARRAQLAGTRISVDAPPSVAGSWDRPCLETVIDGLLDNAIKFAAAKPIAVTLRAEGTWVELLIRDAGIGIPPERLSAIFEPFERAVPKEHFGGLGLGLYIARAIVTAHGGSIGVTSKPGQGSTFVVRLPLDGS